MKDNLEKQGVELRTADADLRRVFTWAKKQALAYAFGDDPVGPWYEAALPGRESFCMRDVCHQATGAHFLGLAEFTKNMLSRFAEHVSDSKDWCSLWEINRLGEPPVVDFRDEHEFWYCLPANFDVLDCCYRMYLLTGNKAYLRDPVFLNFYHRTAHDYVERWDLGLDKIMKRSRIMNIRKEPGGESRFRMNRGVPGYNESNYDYSISFDQIAAQCAGYRALGNIMLLKGADSDAETYFERSRDLREFLDAAWWNVSRSRYYEFCNKNGDMHAGEGTFRGLYWNILDDRTRIGLTLEQVLANAPHEPTRKIESQSHIPEICFRYGEIEAAYDQIFLLAESDRKEYPEVSFSIIGAIVEGLMGVGLETYPPADALRRGGYVERIITTQSRLSKGTKWAEALNLSIRSNRFALRHDGARKSSLENTYGPALLWKAHFPGTQDELLINGRPAGTKTIQISATGEIVSWVTVVVGAGEEKVVEAPK